MAKTLSEIVSLAQSGDQESMDFLYRRYRKEMVVYADCSLRNLHDSEEIVQDAFINAFTRIEQLKSPSAFGSWLRSIVWRQVINRCNKRREDLCPAELLDRADDRVEQPSEVAGKQEVFAKLNYQIDQLSDISARSIREYYWSGKTLRQLAVENGKPLGTMKRRLFVARKQLSTQGD